MQPFGTTFRITVLDHDILAFRVAKIAETLPESFAPERDIGRTEGREKSYPRDLRRLLREADCGRCRENADCDAGHKHSACDHRAFTPTVDICAERTAQRPTREHRERAVRCSGKFDARV